MRSRLLSISSFLLLAHCTTSFAFEMELKQAFTSKNYSSTLDIDHRKDGSIKEFDYRKRDEIRSESLLLIKGQTEFEGLSYVLRLGYEYRKERDERREFNSDFEFKNSKTRDEHRSDRFIGLGFRQDIRDLDWADRVLIQGYYDHYYKRSYSAQPIGDKAEDFSGDSKAYELELEIGAEFSTFRPDLYLTPKLEYRKRREKTWLEEIEQEYEAASQDERYRASIWLNWITPIDGLEVYGGPSYRWENDAELKKNGWQWEDRKGQQWDIKCEYEAASSGLEFELKYSNYYSGHNKGQQRFKLEVSYEF